MDQGARGDGHVRPRSHGRFAHEVVFYDGADDRARALLPFVCEGVELGEPVLLVLRADAIEALRDELRRELGSDHHAVEFADMAEVGANPARIIPAWRRFVAEHADGGRVRGIGEPVWAGRRDDEIVEAQLHEGLLNLAFEDGPGWHLICPYDTSVLPESVVEEARRSHPLVNDPERPSSGYRGHDYAMEAFGSRLPEAPRWAHRLPFTLESLTEVRERVQRAGRHAGLADDVVEDLVLAAHELASNSIVHATGEGVLMVWAEPDALVVEVRDHGHIDDPLVGRAEPDHQALGGRGIWMANQLCDLVQVRSDGTGTQVRLRAWR
ncbi:MAG TPA: sensor histidine kinase [Marmoricola sp.]|nr:sensor histidine kinase [Marmoricola sp.]